MLEIRFFMRELSDGVGVYQQGKEKEKETETGGWIESCRLVFTGLAIEGLEADNADAWR